MPYVSEERRRHLETSAASTVGDLTYVIMQEMVNYVVRKKRGLSYALLAEAKAAADNASAEFYRVKIAPYEDEKREENGDVEAR